MHFYTHNIGEFAIDTKYMTFEQKGIYVDLIDQYLATGKPLASDWLANIKRMASENAVDAVLALCFTQDGNVFRSEKLDLMLAEYEQRAEKNRENARKSRKKPEKSTDASESVATGKRVASESLTTNNQEPITKNQEKEIDKEKVADASPESVADAPSLESKEEKAQAKLRRLDVETLPYDWFVDCIDLQPELDAYKLFDEFSDYWANEAGKKGMKLDWRKTWKNYLRNLPTWKHANYVREGLPMWDGKPWRRPVDPDSSLGRYYAMQEDAIKQSKAEDELLAYAETRLKNFGLINHDPF